MLYAVKNSLQEILVLIHAMLYSIFMAFLKKLLSVEMLLRDMLYVSYLIPHERVRRFLPPYLFQSSVFLSVILHIRLFNFVGGCPHLGKASYPTLIL